MQLGGEDSWQNGGWWTLQSHIHMQINREAQRGSETDHAILGFEHTEIKPETTD